MDLLDRFKEFDIILASQSPRRKTLMENAGVPFRVMARPTAEIFPAGLSPEQVVTCLCEQKAALFSKEIQTPGVIVVTADTIVVHHGIIINKPGGREDAIRMLAELSASTHEVYTGVCLSSADRKLLITDQSKVSFRSLSEEEIVYYVDNYAPYDKAGAYGIQEWIGFVGITGIEGSFHNVMGLPIQKVYLALQEMVL